MAETDSIMQPEVLAFLKQREKNLNLPLPRLEALPPALREIGETIATISGNWNPVELYTPANVDAEKTTFLAAIDSKRVYNPKFTYDKVDAKAPDAINTTTARGQLNDQLNLVRAAHHRAPPAEKRAALALYGKILDDLATLDMIDGMRTGNESQIANSMDQKYGRVGRELVAAAEARLKAMINGEDTKVVEGTKTYLTKQEQENLKKMEFDANGVKDAFEWALKELGILAGNVGDKGYVVEISEEAKDIDVRDKSRTGRPTIMIPAKRPKSRTITGDWLLQLMEHEIGAHARQSMNGYEMFGVGGGPLKIDDESLYEGLAKRNDEAFYRDFFGTSQGEPVPYYVLAIRDAQNKLSFRQIFDRQMDYWTKTVPATKGLEKGAVDADKIEKCRDNAWRITYRVLRGHTDTTNKQGYANTKDAAYFKGWLLDKQLRDAGFGHMNEAAVMAGGGLKMIADYQVTPKNLKHPYKPLARKYWDTVLKHRQPPQKAAA